MAPEKVLLIEVLSDQQVLIDIQIPSQPACLPQKFLVSSFFLQYLKTTHQTNSAGYPLAYCRECPFHPSFQPRLMRGHHVCVVLF